MFKLKNREIIRTAEDEPKFTGSYKKLYLHAKKLNYSQMQRD